MKILFATLGTLGDLNPYLGLGEELVRRGHQVTIAAGQSCEPYFSGSAVKFLAIRPDIALSEGVGLERYFDYVRCNVNLMEEILFPSWFATFHDLEPAVLAHDLFISNQMVMPSATLAGATGTPWMECVFAPVAMGRPPYPEWPYPSWVPNYHDIFDEVMPLFAELTLVIEQMKNGPERRSRFREPVTPPYFGLFSKHLVEPQSYWHDNAKVTGFVFRDGHWNLPPALSSFLASGAPPLVMALGSTLAHCVDVELYFPFVEAARALDMRIVLLAGGRTEKLKELYGGGTDVFLAPSAAYGKLFPHAALVIHHAGIGTLAQTLRAGKPSLIVPFCYDQPMNAFFAEQLGVGKHILQQDCEAGRIASCISELLDEETCARAKILGQRIGSEDGIGSACDEIEKFMATAEPAKHATQHR